MSNLIDLVNKAYNTTADGKPYMSIGKPVAGSVGGLAGSYVAGKGFFDGTSNYFDNQADALESLRDNIEIDALDIENINGGNESWYENLIGTNKDGNSTLLGGTGLDWMNLGLAGLGYMNERDKLKQGEKALQDQLVNSRMQRDLTYDQLATQKGVQQSLAGAFGANTTPYTESLKKFDKYQSDDKAV